MSAISKRIIDTAFGSLELIGELAAEMMGADPARAKMIAATIKLIVDSVRAGSERSKTPEDVITEIEKAMERLKAGVSELRKDIRDELDRRVPPADPTP